MAMPNPTPPGAPPAFDAGLGMTEDAWRKASNSWFRLGAPVSTFQVADKQTGEIVIVDDRTFNAAVHERLDGLTQGGGTDG